jgi:zinc protease
MNSVSFHLKRSLFLFGCLFTLIYSNAQQNFPSIDIPYKKFVLSNGLTLLVHEDHKAPIVAVNIWYHVGSKNEKPGKSGFAHLFEHLMFNGSENYNDDYFKLMERIGATDLNGTTNNDRTNYFENIPSSALDLALWAESDRMGHLLGALTQARLDEQRGVVQNEKRQGENEPYAVAYELTTKSTYPAGHPYSWTVIGSMEDLNAASLDDVKEWFKSYYGPNNAVLIIAGDVNTDSAVQKVKRYFGDIPASPPISKHSEWIAKMESEHRQIAQDRVPQARLQKTWNIPSWGSQEETYLSLASDILTGGKSSRLYKRLVYDDQIASNVYSYIDDKEIGSQFLIVADAKPGVPLSKIEKIIDEELTKLNQTGPTEAELLRYKTQYFARFVKGLERIGGFGGKSDVLAQNEVYAGNADHYKQVLDWVKNAKVADVKKASAEWLGNNDYVLEIVPYPTFDTEASTIDRKQQPVMGDTKMATFPDIQQTTLKNGLKVYLVERKSVPVVNLQLMVDAGYAADKDGIPGLATLAMNMLTEGTPTRTSLKISDELADLGANVNTFSDLDYSYVSMKALKWNLDKSLDLFTDIVQHPAFPEKDFDRLKKEQILNIAQEQAQPFSMGLRILPKLIYGEGHPYSFPFTGSGYESTVNKITRNDLVKFHDTWFAPNNSTLLVVGDITMKEVKDKLETAFAGWKEKKVPTKTLADVPMPDKPSVYIIDKPGALQSILFAGEIGPSGKDEKWMAIEMMNRILGGEFTSRLNMNLREDKHWSYGAGSVALDAKGPGMFVGYAPVQTDKTKESIVEMKKELEQYTTDKPATDEEFGKVQKNAILQLPGSWETNGAVIRSMGELVKYERDPSYLQKYGEHIQQLNVGDIRTSATRVVQPSKLTWVIVGDRSKIEKGIQELNLGTIKYIDTEGNAAKGSKTF